MVLLIFMLYKIWVKSTFHDRPATHQLPFGLLLVGGIATISQQASDKFNLRFIASQGLNSGLVLEFTIQTLPTHSFRNTFIDNIYTSDPPLFGLSTGAITSELSAINIH